MKFSSRENRWCSVRSGQGEVTAYALVDKSIYLPDSQFLINTKIRSIYFINGLPEIHKTMDSRETVSVSMYQLQIRNFGFMHEVV